MYRYRSAARCLSTVSSTLNASSELASESTPLRATAMDCMGIFAEKLISTMNAFS